MSLVPVCILAGGLGTRLGTLVREVPKSLVEVAGRPFLEYQLESLAAHGAREIVLCVGHQGERIEDVIGDGAAYDVNVRYSYDPPHLAGTAGAVRGALDLLPQDGFLVLYGDTYLRVDYRAVQAQFRATAAPALMTVLNNDGRWGVSNAAVTNAMVTAYAKGAPSADLVWIDYGLSMITSQALTVVPDEETDLASVFSELARRGNLAAFEVTERFYEIGTPAALEETAAYFARRRRPIAYEASINSEHDPATG